MLTNNCLVSFRGCITGGSGSPARRTHGVRCCRNTAVRLSRPPDETSLQDSFERHVRFSVRDSEFRAPASGPLARSTMGPEGLGCRPIRRRRRGSTDVILPRRSRLATDGRPHGYPVRLIRIRNIFVKAQISNSSRYLIIAFITNSTRCGTTATSLALGSPERAGPFQDLR